MLVTCIASCKKKKCTWASYEVWMTIKSYKSRIRAGVGGLFGVEFATTIERALDACQRRKVLHILDGTIIYWQEGKHDGENR